MEGASWCANKACMLGGGSVCRTWEDFMDRMNAVCVLRVVLILTGKTL